jgi:hypothetical protein
MEGTAQSAAKVEAKLNVCGIGCYVSGEREAAACLFKQDEAAWQHVLLAALKTPEPFDQQFQALPLDVGLHAAHR